MRMARSATAGALLIALGALGLAPHLDAQSDSNPTNVTPDHPTLVSYGISAADDWETPVVLIGRPIQEVKSPRDPASGRPTG